MVRSGISQPRLHAASFRGLQVHDSDLDPRCRTHRQRGRDQMDRRRGHGILVAVKRVMGPFRAISWMTDALDEVRGQAWRDMRTGASARDEATNNRAKLTGHMDYKLRCTDNLMALVMLGSSNHRFYCRKGLNLQGLSIEERPSALRRGHVLRDGRGLAVKMLVFVRLDSGGLRGGAATSAHTETDLRRNRSRICCCHHWLSKGGWHRPKEDGGIGCIRDERIDGRRHRLHQHSRHYPI